MEYKKLSENTMKKHQPTLFLLFVGSLGVLLVLYATAPFGPGISGDSVFSLAGAENLMSGNGYLDHYGKPLTIFPPLLSFFIALLMKLFNIRMVANNLLGLDINEKTRFSTGEPFFKVWISLGLREKKATSEPETKPDNPKMTTNNNPLTI